jgi:hypothetical protein
MADDAILRETKANIDRLFAQVSGGAGSASKGLYDVGRAAGRAESGISSLASGAGDATRATGSFVSAVRNMETASGSYSTTLSSSMAKLSDDIGFSVGKATNKIDEGLGKFAAGLGVTIKAGAAGARALTKTSSTESVSLVKKLQQAVKGPLKAFGSLGPVMLGTIGAAATLEDYVDDSYKTWRMLSTAGITLGNDLNQVGGMAGRTRLTFEELAGSLAKSSESLASFGGMADLGTEVVVSMQEAMQDTVEGYKGSTESYMKSMKMMGIAPQESMNLMTSLMEDQVFASKIRGMQDGQDATRRAEMTAEYIAQLDQLSKLTGKSRESLAKDMAQKAQDAQFSATLLDMDKDQAAAAKAQLEFIEKSYGKDAADLFKARLAGVVPTSDGARKIFATGLGNVVSEMADQTRNTTGEAAGGILDSFHGTLATEAERTRDMLKPLALAGANVSGSFANLFNATNSATLKNQALIDQLAESTGQQIKGMDRLAEAIDNAYNKVTGRTVEGDTITRDEKSGLLERRAELEMISNMAGTAVQAWLSNIGWGGGSYDRFGSGGLMDTYELGAAGVVGMVNTFATVDGPALGGGDKGEGRGFNTMEGIIDNLMGGMSGVSSSKQGGKLSSILDGQLGVHILNSPEAEAQVLAELGKQGMDTGQAKSIIEKSKFKTAAFQTGKTEQELKSMMGAVGPGGMYGSAKSLREVVSDVAVSDMKKEQEDTAKKIHGPIVSKLNEIKNILKEKGVIGEKETDKKKKGNGASGSRSGAITKEEGIQIAAAGAEKWSTIADIDAMMADS